MKESLNYSNFENGGGFCANSDAKGRLKDWNDQIVEIDISESSHIANSYRPEKRKRQSTSEFVRKRFGVIEDIVEESCEPDVDLQPVADLLRRRRKSTVTIFRELLGL